MNKVILCGRLTRDPDVRYSQGAEQICTARYTLAVDRRNSKKDSKEQSADFIPCIAFRRNGEFAERWLRQGTKIMVTGRIQTGSYTNREGQKVYTTDVIVEEQEFAESKNAQGGAAPSAAAGTSRTSTAEREFGSSTPDFAGSYNPAAADADGFMTIPDSVDDEGLPFS